MPLTMPSCTKWCPNSAILALALSHMLILRFPRLTNPRFSVSKSCTRGAGRRRQGISAGEARPSGSLSHGLPLLPLM